MSMLCVRTRCEMSSTRPMVRSDPANAAPTDVAGLMTCPAPSTTIITTATTSLAPEEMPSTKGSAMGLAKKV